MLRHDDGACNSRFYAGLSSNIPTISRFNRDKYADYGSRHNV